MEVTQGALGRHLINTISELCDFGLVLKPLCASISSPGNETITVPTSNHHFENLIWLKPMQHNCPA